MTNQAPENFVLAQEQQAHVREHASVASTALRVARANLEELQCGTEFVGTQLARELFDDAHPDDVIEFDAQCALLPGHDGEHSHEDSPEEYLSEEYLKRKASFNEALSAWWEADERLVDAEDSLIAESCQAPGVWCALWNGHTGSTKSRKY